MSRLRKVAVGVCLLWLSILYLQFVNYRVMEKKTEAVLMIYPYIHAEVVESEYMGENLVIYGQEKIANDGCGFYRVTFRIENLSSKSYNSGINDIIKMDRSSDEVDAVMKPLVGEEKDYLCTLSPSIPGKTDIDVVYYLEVKKDVGMCHASYRPVLANEEIVTLDILLAS